MSENNLTPKQEKFCQVYVETGNASEAYRQSYNVGTMPPESIYVKANEVKSNVKVSLRIKELQEEHRKRHMFTVDTAHQQYIEALEMAKLKEKPESIIAATKAQCELHGIEPPKKVEVGGTLVRIVDMTGKKDD